MMKKYITRCSGLFTGLTMKLQRRVALLLFVIFGVLNVQGQVTVTGAITGNGDYTTLGAAFTAIGTVQTAANITIAITGNSNISSSL